MKKVSCIIVVISILIAAVTFTGCADQEAAQTTKEESVPETEPTSTAEEPPVEKEQVKAATPDAEDNRIQSIHIQDGVDYDDLQETLDEEMDKLMEDDEMMDTVPSDKYQYMSIATITENGQSITIPVVNTEESFSIAMSATGRGDGITTQAQLIHNTGEEQNYISQKTQFEVEQAMIALKGVEHYRDVVAQDMVIGQDETGAQVASCRIDYVSNIFGDTQSQNFMIVKMAQVSEEYYVLLNVTVNNSLSDENTEAVWEEVCQAYGLELE